MEVHCRDKSGEENQKNTENGGGAVHAGSGPCVESWIPSEQP
jgi:hypothetical protein